MVYVAHIKLHELVAETDNVTSEKLLISAVNMSNALDILGAYAGSKELEIEWFKKIGDENNEDIIVITTKEGDNAWAQTPMWDNIISSHGVD